MYPELLQMWASVETLYHPPVARLVGYGEEKVQTPNSERYCCAEAVKAVAGKNQQVVGSSPSAGSILGFSVLLA